MKSSLIERRSFMKNLVEASLKFSVAPALFRSFFATQSFADGTASTSEMRSVFPYSVCHGNLNEFEVALNVVQGRIPSDIQGHLFLMESVDTPERINLAAGFGVISRIDFAGANARMKRRRIMTSSVRARDAVDSEFGFSFEAHGMAYMSFPLGVLNSCNTSVIPLGEGRLALGYDAGEPHEIDPVSLEVVTPIGARDEWKSGLPATLTSVMARNWLFPMIRSTAHPYYDENTQEFFSVNFGGSINVAGFSLGAHEFTNLIVWDTHGKLNHWALVDESGSKVVIQQAVHQICVTRNHIIILDTPFSFEAEAIFGVHTSRAQLPDTSIWIIKRRDIVKGSEGTLLARKVALAKEWEHMVSDYNDDGDLITLYGASSPASDLSEWISSGDRNYFDGKNVRAEVYGLLSAPMDRGDCGRIRIQVRGNHASLADLRLVSHPHFNWNTALYAYRDNGKYPEKLEQLYWVSFGFQPELLTEKTYNLYKNYPHRSVALSSLPRNGEFPAVFRFDCNQLAIADGFSMPPGYFVSSPQFIPRSGGDGSATDGYIACTVCSDTSTSGVSSGDEIWLFDARALSAGPICQLAHPQINFALTLHTLWQDQISTRTASYRISPQENYGELIKKLPSHIADMVSRAIYNP